MTLLPVLLNTHRSAQTRQYTAGLV